LFVKTTYKYPDLRSFKKTCKLLLLAVHKRRLQSGGLSSSDILRQGGKEVL